MAHGAPAQPSDQPEVLAVSALNPKIRTVRVQRPRPEETSFLRAAFKGMGITAKHFFRNVTTGRDIETVQYPEEKKPYPERFRGLHRLMKRDDGQVRCVACMMCPTVCPANCITIVPAESDDKRIEKYPAVFEIDELRCVVCGLCVEACPCDAIRMDTGVHAPAVEERHEAIEHKHDLLSRGIRSTAVQGGRGKDWRRSEKATK